MQIWLIHCLSPTLVFFLWIYICISTYGYRMQPIGHLSPYSNLAFLLWKFSASTRMILLRSIATFGEFSSTNKCMLLLVESPSIYVCMHLALLNFENEMFGSFIRSSFTIYYLDGKLLWGMSSSSTVCL